MRYDAEWEKLIFSTGKKIDAHLGIIGISPEGEISTGYDDGVDEKSLTPDEKRELADYAIAQWVKWRQI